MKRGMVQKNWYNKILFPHFSIKDNRECPFQVAVKKPLRLISFSLCVMRSLRQTFAFFENKLRTVYFYLSREGRYINKAASLHLQTLLEPEQEPKTQTNTHRQLKCFELRVNAS